MKKTMMVLTAALLAFMPMPTYAEMDAVRLQESMNSLNRLKPLQNPQYKKSATVLKGTVIDQQNRTIGKVEDALIDSETGNVNALQVAFDRLRLGAPVYLNYADMKINMTSNGYQLGMKSEDIAAIYPSLMANIQTASGDGVMDVVSMKTALGKSVVADDGFKVGEITDVLLNNRGTQVQGVYVSVNAGTLRNIGVAVPMSALAFTSHHGRINASLPRAQADMLIEYARQRK